MNPMATHEGVLQIGETSYPVAVLDDGTRVFTRTGLLNVLGRPYKGQYKGQLPAAISAPNLKPLVSDHLQELLIPIKYRNKSGGSVSGYKAEVLIDICSVYIDADKRGILTPIQRPIASRCEIILRAMAKTGITALIDEATGYQELRDRKALQAILEKFLQKEYAAWAKKFPTEFYQEVFRLRKWKWVGMMVNRPQFVGRITNDIVYERLLPGVLKELRELNPKDERGFRKVRHHQFLTADIGHPALSQHIHALLAIMRISDDWDSFYLRIQKAFPKRGDQLSLDFEEA